jgi:hypothetical protein
MTHAEQSARFDLVRAIEKARDIHGEEAWRVVVSVLGEQLGNAQRLIATAEAQTPGEQPPIVLLWEDYKELVAERDKARIEYRSAQGLANQFLRDADQALRERDQARGAAAACYARATAGYGAGSPGDLISFLEGFLEVEDYTRFPDWLTRARIR